MSNHRFATMKNLSRGRVRLALLALCLLGGAQGAMAVCKRYTGTPAGTPPFFAERSIDMAMGTVVISPNTAVGELIKSQPFSISGGTEHMFDCMTGNANGVGGMVHGVMLQGTLVPGYTDRYTTAVPGVGIRLTRLIAGPDTGSGPTSTKATYPHDISVPYGYGELYAGSSFLVELFKTAPVTGNGPLAAGTYTRYYGDGDPGNSAITTYLSGNGITIITPSCTVDTGSRSFSVQLGNVALSRFGGMGTTAGDKPFKIQLNCQPGQNAQNLVYLQMDATQDPTTSAPGVLKITGGTDIASGVGIQVLDKDAAPVPFGDDVLVGPSKDGAYVLPYTARYYQTGSTVTPGRADGTATFTLNYK